MSEEIKTVLSDIGYTLRDFGPSFRAKPLYRDSGNSTSLAVNKVTGRFVDFSANITGSFEELVRLSLGLKDLKDAQKWLENKIDLKSLNAERPKIFVPKTFSKKLLDDITPIHTYWIDRGIDKGVIESFRGGIVSEGQAKGRYVFPIFSGKDKLLGFAARDLFNNTDRPKWKLIGDKMNWVYPLFLSYEECKKKDEVIIVESIGDCLALWNAGIKNVLVLFGTKLGKKRLSFLLKANLKRIVLSLNNDFDQDVNVGQESSDFIFKNLLNFFDKDQIIVKPPLKKDFGEKSKEEIIEWYKLPTNE